jgi:hypothetical protein
LKWAREKDCPWDEATCASAANSKSPRKLEVLKWLIENRSGRRAVCTPFDMNAQPPHCRLPGSAQGSLLWSCTEN